MSVDCRQCISEIEQSSLRANHSLELTAELCPETRSHLDGCEECRRRCTELMQVESQLRSLRAEVAAPDMRGSIMARLRQGERAEMPKVAPAPPSATGVREMLLVTLAVTLAVAWEWPLVSSLLPPLAIHWPELNWHWLVYLTPDLPLWSATWDLPCLLATVVLCAGYTRNWQSGQASHG